MSLPPSEAEGYPLGSLQPTTTWGEYNNLHFVIQALLNKMQTATLVGVVKCTNSGGINKVGFVDVVPLINQVNGLLVSEPHTVINNVPYMRLQGGSNAVIIDPQPGDIGICIFASRDISTVKNSSNQGDPIAKQQANPASGRQYSYSDGLYIGGVVNNAPVQWVQFSAAGINITSPNLVELDAPSVTINCTNMVVNATTACTITTPTFTVNGNTYLKGGLDQGVGGLATRAAYLRGPVYVDRDIFSQYSSGSAISLTNHVHGGVTPGSSNTDVPGMTRYNTLLLDRTAWDLVLDSAGNIAMAEPPYALSQDVASAIRLFIGELFYNTSAGIPYFEQILGHAPPLQLVVAYIQNAALTVPGVVQARCYINSFNSRTVTGTVLFVDEAGSQNVLDF